MPQPMAEVSTPLSAELSALYGGWIKRTALHLKIRMPWADLDELLQAGAVGMLEALQRFDTSHGVAFGAFAARRIRGAMIDSLRREGTQRRGECYLDTEQIDQADLQNGTQTPDPLNLLVRAHDKAALAAALKQLPALEYKVLALHFFDEMNNREIAAIMDMSEGYASRVRKRALTSMALFMNRAMNGETV